VCNECTNVVGDEAHVLLKCSLYIDFREELFYLAQNVNSDFMSFSDNQKSVFLFSDVNMKMLEEIFYIVYNFILCVCIYILILLFVLIVSCNSIHNGSRFNICCILCLKLYYNCNER